jgi:hypothetical protein
MASTQRTRVSRRTSRALAEFQQLVENDPQRGEDLWLALLRKRTLLTEDPGLFESVLSHPRIERVADLDVPDTLSGQTISRISAIYEFVLAAKDFSSKRRHGQFYTPDDVAEFMASCSMEFGDGIWLDPCCGVGNLTYYLANTQASPAEFLRSKIRLIDLDETALLSARILLSTSFQKRDTGFDLFSELDTNCFTGDFLSPSVVSAGCNGPDYDFIIMNPPYARSKAPDDEFESSDSADLYAFFLEKALKTSRGVISITPQSFTNGGRHRDLRSLMLRNCRELTVFCFDNVPDNVFKGLKFGSENSNRANSTRPAITVAVGDGPDSQRESPRFSITPLIRWRAEERRVLFRNLPAFLCNIPNVNSDVFPKVYPGLEEYFAALEAFPQRISDLVVPEPEGRWSLQVPSTPRYFITATERELERSSVRTLRFSSYEDWTSAYLTLNSSVAYYWWRAVDGGMSLAKSTLMSVPIPMTESSNHDAIGALIESLRKSESENLVSKLNSGKLNFNVKHPLELIDRINRLLAPDVAPMLLALHLNSNVSEEFTQHFREREARPSVWK